MRINIYTDNHKPNKVDCIFYFSCIKQLFKDLFKKMSRSDFEDFAGKWKKLNCSGYEVNFHFWCWRAK